METSAVIFAILFCLAVAHADDHDHDMISENVCSKSRQLRCKDNVCMDDTKFCDGKPDCKDGSDEEDCWGSNPSHAFPCKAKDCRAPHCHCSKDGRQGPPYMKPKETPQMIMLTFDNEFDDEFADSLHEILRPAFFNPNGCNVKGTVFVSHNATDYSLVSVAHSAGHEIAALSITNKKSHEYWRTLSPKGWKDEVVGQKHLISRLSNIPKADIKGMRAPHLFSGTNNMFEMMAREEFMYDASLTAPYSGLPVWPYTLDYRVSHECFNNNTDCPSKSFPGIWEIPINPMDQDLQATVVRDRKTGKSRNKYPTTIESGCTYADSCLSLLRYRRRFFAMLSQEFYRRYHGNRAPMGIHVRSSILKKYKFLREPLRKFVESVLAFDDVYIVRMSDVIEWMKNPVPVGEDLKNFEPWKVRCVISDSLAYGRSVTRCNMRMCGYRNGTDLFEVCNACPERNPTVKNWHLV